MSATPKNPLGLPMEDLVAHAAGCATDTLAADVAARMADLARGFAAACAGLPPAPLTVFIFHLQLTEDSRRIAYADMAPADQGEIDYRPVLAHAFAMARGFHPDARILYVTGSDDPADFVPADVVTVRLPLRPQALMYERVIAMAAYIHSAAFASDTVFLDSDAFANRPLGPVFRLPFDVAVTYRNDPGLMKINEGAIFAAHRRGGAGARGFFRRYLATYEALCADPLVTKTYGDIRRWRGGQLSLSGLCHIPGLVDETDNRDIAGARVVYLPCAGFNFMIRGGAEYPLALLRRKYVVHLKGLQKQSLPGLVRIQRMLLEERMGKTEDAPPPSAPQDAGGFVKPFLAFFNKEYNEPPFGSKEALQGFAGLLNGMVQTLQANRPDSGAVAVDDMLVWFRNAGFLQQPDFIAAFAPYAADQALRARVWRIYTLCWAAQSCLSLPGDFVDLGCYDGRTVDVMERYCRFAETAPEKRWWLYDIFDDPPAEARKSGHGPGLFGQVQALFAGRPRMTVIRGAVPGSFAEGIPERIAFAQFDLNAAAPELAALEILHDRLVPGGLVVFDDFGFRRYRASHEAEAAFFRARGAMVWESPTGQGLYIRR